VRDFEILLGLLFVAALTQPIARRLDVPLAIVQVVCGLALSAIPLVASLRLDPDVTFTLFVPPLLFYPALSGSVRDVRRNARPILLLAVPLVLITTAAVAAAAHAIAPSLSWASAFVLGAIVAPPDAEVTTSIARRLGLSLRLVTVLEGETLFNDATAFVTYRMAVRTVAIGAFSLAAMAGEFARLAAIGIVIGLAIGWVMAQLPRLELDSAIDATMTLITPFAAYLLAERVGGSGVLAVISAGFCFSRFAPRRAAPRSRIRAREVWETVLFCFGSLVFTLIGVQIGTYAPTLWRGQGASLLWLIAIVTATVVVARAIWILLTAYVPRFLSRRLRERDPYPSWRTLAVLTWAGLRGGDTLVMVLAIPFVTSAGNPFPGRETIVGVGLGVTLVTLVLPGLTMRAVIKRLALPHDDTVESEERHARLEAERAALAHLEQLAARDHLPGDAIAYLESTIRQRTRLDLDDIDHAGGHDGVTAEDVVRRVDREMREIASQAVVLLRDQNVIGQEALRRVQRDLDLDEIRNIRG